MSLTICFAQEAISNSTKKTEAKISSENWLKLIDNKEYAESWSQAATIFKSTVSQEDWVSTISNLKLQFGKTISRKLLLLNYTTTLPGAPEGEYVVIQFKTNFELRSNAIETIVPMKEKDGKWRVSGYFIK